MVSEQNLNVMTLDILKVRKEMTEVKKESRRAREQCQDVPPLQPHRTSLTTKRAPHVG